MNEDTRRHEDLPSARTANCQGCRGTGVDQWDPRYLCHDCNGDGSRYTQIVRMQALS